MNWRTVTVTSLDDLKPGMRVAGYALLYENQSAGVWVCAPHKWLSREWVNAAIELGAVFEEPVPEPERPISFNIRYVKADDGPHFTVVTDDPRYPDPLKFDITSFVTQQVVGTWRAAIRSAVNELSNMPQYPPDYAPAPEPDVED